MITIKRIQIGLGFLIVWLLAVQCQSDKSGPDLRGVNNGLYYSDCAGSAMANPSSVSTLSFLAMPSWGLDIWGYYDELNDKEYALFGMGEGLAVVDVSNPANPFIASTVDSIVAFDVKVWKNYAYTVTGNRSQPGRIIDLIDPLNPVIVGTINGGHNLFIDSLGFMYKSCPRIEVYNLNKNPLEPEFIWDLVTDGCHDMSVVGDRLYAFRNDFTEIYNISKRTKPVRISQIIDPSIGLHHSGWISGNHEYLYITDEDFSANGIGDISVWDITNLENPQKLETFEDTNAVVHNLYVQCNTAVTSYYSAGFRFFKIEDGLLTLVEQVQTEWGWGIYPFSRSGLVFGSDTEGLYIFRVN